MMFSLFSHSVLSRMRVPTVVLAICVLFFSSLIQFHAHGCSSDNIDYITHTTHNGIIVFGIHLHICHGDVEDQQCGRRDSRHAGQQDNCGLQISMGDTHSKQLIKPHVIYSLLLLPFISTDEVSPEAGNGNAPLSIGVYYHGFDDIGHSNTPLRGSPIRIIDSDLV